MGVWPSSISMLSASKAIRSFAYARYVPVGNSTATSRARCPGPTKNGTWWSLPSAVSRKAYTPLARSSGTSNVRATGQSASAMSSSWKWMASYSSGASRKSSTTTLERGTGDTTDRAVHTASVEAVRRLVDDGGEKQSVGTLAPAEVPACDRLEAVPDASAKPGRRRSCR